MINIYEVIETNAMIEQDESGCPYDYNGHQPAGLLWTRTLEEA